MGALFGVLGGFRQSEIDQMALRLAHRGSHCHVERVNNRVVLGAIADTPQRHVHRDGDRLLACDASIFNQSELNGRLTDAAFDRESMRPAALLLDLHRQIGPDGIESIDGNFAFALVNLAKQEVVLGRDYFGCAPLYYTVLPSGGIAFASEYKALLCLSELKPEVDRDMLQYVQHTKKLPVGRTLLSNVQAAMPGQIQKFSFRGEQRDSHTFPPLVVDAKIENEEDAVRQIGCELTNSIQQRADDLDPIGVALSGGIDSIGVAFILRQQYPNREIHTFTAGYGASDPEVQTANQVAQQIKSIHHEVITSPVNLEANLRKIIWHLENPFAGSEVPQLYEIGNVAKQYVPTLLSGQGADSLFAGMPRYKILWLMKCLPPFRQSLREFYTLTQTGLKPQSMSGKLFDRLYFRGRLPRVPEIMGATWRPEPIQLPPMSRQFINATMARGFQNGQCQDTLKFERSFGAWGVEYRSPFSNVKFVQFAYTVSDHLKIRRGIEKYILRKALGRFVPQQFLRIPKFPQRMKNDLQFANSLDEMASSVFSEQAVHERGFFKFASLQPLFRQDAEKAYRYEGAMRLWTAILTELWAQEFLDKRAVGVDRMDERSELPAATT